MKIENIEQACEKLNAVGHRSFRWGFHNASVHGYSADGTLSEYYEAEDAIRLAQGYEDAELIKEYDSAMRSIASYLGTGGYNAEELSPATLQDKITWGIGHIVEVEIKRKWMKEQRPSDSEMMSLLKRTNRDFELEIADLKRQLSICEERASSPSRRGSA